MKTNVASPDKKRSGQTLTMLTVCLRELVRTVPKHHQISYHLKKEDNLNDTVVDF
mgnify:CR=1 FL=1